MEEMEYLEFRGHFYDPDQIYPKMDKTIGQFVHDCLTKGNCTDEVFILKYDSVCIMLKKPSFIRYMETAPDIIRLSEQEYKARRNEIKKEKLKRELQKLEEEEQNG